MLTTEEQCLSGLSFSALLLETKPELRERWFSFDYQAGTCNGKASTSRAIMSDSDIRTVRSCSEKGSCVRGFRSMIYGRTKVSFTIV